MNDSHMLPLQRSCSSGALLKGFYCMVSTGFGDVGLELLRHYAYTSVHNLNFTLVSKMKLCQIAPSPSLIF